MTSLGEAINEEGEHRIFGIPADIMLVLGIDAILIALRLGGTFKPNQFIGAKAIGTTALITAHLLAFA